MQIKSKKSKSRRGLVITIILIAVLALGGGGYWAWLTIDQNNNNNTAEEKTDKESKEDSSDDSNSNTTNQSGETSGDKEPPQNDVPQTTAGDLSVSAHAFVDGGTLTVGTILIYPSQAGGTCTLTIGSFSTSSKIDASHNGPSYSVCDDFSVPISSLSGNSYTLKVTTDNAAGSINGNF